MIRRPVHDYGFEGPNVASINVSYSSIFTAAAARIEPTTMSDAS